MYTSLDAYCTLHGSFFLGKPSTPLGPDWHPRVLYSTIQSKSVTPVLDSTLLSSFLSGRAYQSTRSILTPPYTKLHNIVRDYWILYWTTATKYTTLVVYSALHCSLPYGKAYHSTRSILTPPCAILYNIYVLYTTLCLFLPVPIIPLVPYWHARVLYYTIQIQNYTTLVVHST